MIYVLRYALVALYTVFWGTYACFVLPFQRDVRTVNFIARSWVGWCLASCGVEVETDGLEGVDWSQPMVMMSNHQSLVDTAAIILTLPVAWRFVAKRELVWVPFFGWALALGDQIIVDRKNRSASVRSLKRAAERVRRGAHVIIFPEGTRSQGGTLGEFKSGGFHLAIDAQVPVLPITVSGTCRITPKRSLRFESGRVLVRFGNPIPTEKLTIEDRTHLKEQVREAILDGFDPELQAPHGRPPARGC